MDRSDSKEAEKELLETSKQGAEQGTVVETQRDENEDNESSVITESRGDEDEDLEQELGSDFENEIMKDEEISESYVAADIVQQIKNSSIKRPTSPVPYQHSIAVDVRALQNLELQAKRLSKHVDNVIEQQKSQLRIMGELAKQNLQVYQSGVSKTCDSVENLIKSGMQLMVKSDELSQKMQPIYNLSQQIQDLKRASIYLETAFQ